MKVSLTIETSLICLEGAFLLAVLSKVSTSSGFSHTPTQPPLTKIFVLPYIVNFLYSITLPNILAGAESLLNSSIINLFFNIFNIVRAGSPTET